MGQRSDVLFAKAKVVAISGSILGIAATFVPDGLIFRSNRIASGEHTALFAAFGDWGWVVLALWALALLAGVSRLPYRPRGIIATAAGGVISILLVWRAGVAASLYAERTGDIARTSLGWAFWVALFACYVLIFAATAWIGRGGVRTALSYLPIAGVGVLLTSGELSALAIAREYANNADSFWGEFRLHLAYVAGSVAVGLASGFLLGLLAARRARFEPLVFGTLNVLQVLPTLAFIGLMNPLLTALSNRYALVADLGVRGVGWAPVIIVLSAYAVYPIARNTHTAIISLDPEVIDAARGVGMGRWRLLAEVELPLALPVIVAGLRIALVQTTAGAIIAGLVGGGGLGTFVFLGASETATDLILLGVLPIVTLALFFDRSVLALQTVLGSWGDAS